MLADIEVCDVSYRLKCRRDLALARGEEPFQDDIDPKSSVWNEDRELERTMVRGGGGVGDGVIITG